ncbi:MAG TPA: phosphoribosylanthranilate isomerase, partial [Thiomicrospira sp.]|nr:phosphoribosylanthranilate isomerase [Thiomicrospira sp.]
DAIGLVFYAPSPRFVEIEQASNIAKALPAFITKTALFVNPEVEYVKQVLNHVDIDLLQFHGDESAEFCEQFNKPYIKAIRMQESTDLNALALEFKKSAGLLLDAYIPGVPGGTGEQFNWSWIPDELELPVILAGGLTSKNVKQAIQESSPWAVDVSGGVEASKGVKSPEKIMQFMQQVMSTVE